MDYTLTIILTIIVIAAYVICAVYVARKRKDGDLEKRRRWIEQLPSLVSTIGVLGTFFGITIGLIHFDTDNIEGSIPELLAGLSTAFFTSLAGMIGSLLLSRQVNSAYDEEEKGVSDASAAAATIVRAIEALSAQSDKQVQLLTQMQTHFATLSKRDYSEQLKGIDVALATIGGVIPTDEVINIDKKVSQIAGQQATHDDVASLGKPLARIDNNIGELLDAQTAVHSQLEDVSEKLVNLKDKLHSEVVEIEDSMEKTNKLLSQKFDEFTELLKKSNTEALVEVMKRVTEEFQKQMGELINKLVQENFDQLNRSVEQLNTWQIENKEMIASLTKQYRQMADNFEQTSTTLTKVGDDTTHLVGDGGKLHQIVEALNTVMIEDTKFVEITSKLSETVSLTKDNMQQFEESTTKLNDWIKKQRNFKEAVDALIIKLDEISKINDYSDKFWKDAKRGMSDAIGSIQSGINALNGEIASLDEHFYERLNATLSELDTCIQAMVNGRR